MVLFTSDYTEGAHPRVLGRLTETNLEQTTGYGEDEYCRRAAELIKAECGAPGADVHFFIGGTQTNFTLIAAALRPHQGVVSAETGHINAHETGAVEATGHKIIAAASPDGKLTAAQVQKAVDDQRGDPSCEHLVQPKLVYISHPTELGTIYGIEELKALRKTCDLNGLILYLDGARMGYGLAGSKGEVTLKDIARLCDAFYIGGTKVGLLFGEALVIVNDALKPDFRYILKQRGGMLAKGRLLGLQFMTLFEDGLYHEISERAVRLAMRIRESCVRRGYGFLVDSPTNQQFPIIPDKELEKLGAEFGYSWWCRVDERRSAVRFCTSWATTEENVDALCRTIEAL